MTDPGTSSALATALAYHQAWTSQDLDQAMTYIADGITCDAPTAECFTVADGKITRSVLVFDRPSFAPPQG